MVAWPFFLFLSVKLPLLPLCLFLSFSSQQGLVWERKVWVPIRCVRVHVRGRYPRMSYAELKGINTV